MHVVELERSLRQLRLGGHGRGARNSLAPGQAETMSPIDLIACLVSDELTVRGSHVCRHAGRGKWMYAISEKTTDPTSTAGQKIK